MTDQEINKVIAEHIQWKPAFIPKDMTGKPFEGWDIPPDYCNNLNVMAEAKNLLTGEKRIGFIDYLCEVVKQDKNINAGPYSVMTQAFYATAKQQAIAFVKTIGKWD